MEDVKIFAGGGMDTDTAIEFMDKIDYLSAFNIRNTGTERQELGYVTSVEGTIEIPYTLPLGINKCIGAKSFRNIRKAYGFIYNSQLEHLVLEYDFDANTLTKVFQNKVDSGGEDILKLTPSEYVEDMNMFGDELYLLPSNRVPSKLNIKKLKGGEYGVVREEDISVIKPKPTLIPTYDYHTDIGRQSNFIENQLIKFSVQYIYENNQESVFSELSKVYVPEKVDTSLGTQNNSLVVSVPVGTDRVKTIIVAAKFNNSSTWVEVKRSDRDKVIALPDIPIADFDPELRYESYGDGIYKFIFYNDGLYLPIDTLTTDLEYDRVPKKANAQTGLNGTILAYGGLVEGFDPVAIDTSLQVTYEKRIEQQQYVGDNRLEVVDFWTRRITNSKRRYANFTFKGDIKLGDVINLSLTLYGYFSDKWVRNFSYTCTNPAYVNNTLAALTDFCENFIFTEFITIDGFPIDGLPYDIISDYAVEDLNGGAEYRLTIFGFLDARKFEVRPAETSDVNFTAISSLKLNSSRQYGIMYEYPYGRLGGVLTNDSLIADTDSYGTSKGYTPIVTIDINHEPPEEAIGYYIVSTGQTTHNNTIYLVGSTIDPSPFEETETYSKGAYVTFDGNVYKSKIDENTDNPTVTEKWFEIGSLTDYVNESYIALDVTTLKKFNELNNSSVINYDFTEGDRINLISYFDGVTDTYFEPSPDLPVSGFEFDVLVNDKEVTDTGYILKINKGNLDIAPLKGKDVFMEVYTPKKSLEDISEKPFFMIGERYDIIDGAHSNTSIQINSGEVYFKTRRYVRPFDYNDSREYLVEDFNYSDFASTRVDNLGRGFIFDKNFKEEYREAWIRHSDLFNEFTNLNLLNRFKTENVYGIDNGQTTNLYGGIYKMRQRGSSLVVFQETEIGYVPVNTTIYEDVTGQSNVAVSDKLLNNIRYNGNGIGIGRATKSFAEDSGDYYFIDPNKSEPHRADAGGVRPISGKMTKFFRDTLQALTNTKRSYIGFFNSFYKEYILTAELESGVVIEATFDSSSWLGDNYTVSAGDITVEQPTNGNVVYNSLTGIATYTPDTDYAGVDPFTFEFDGIERNVCLSVIAGQVVPTPFFFLDVIDQPLNTVITSNTISVEGINIPVAISIIGGEYEINNSGVWLTTASTVVNGDFVRVRQTSSTLNETETTTTLTIGTVSDTFNVTTISNSVPTMTYTLDVDNNSPNDIDFRIRDNTNFSIIYNEIIETPDIVVGDIFMVIDDGNTMRISIGNTGIEPISYELSVDGVLVDSFTLSSGEVRFINTVKSSVVLFAQGL
jgi:hypothetical protein